MKVTSKNGHSKSQNAYQKNNVSKKSVNLRNNLIPVCHSVSMTVKRSNMTSIHGATIGKILMSVIWAVFVNRDMSVKMAFWK